MINLALNILGEHSDKIVAKLWIGLDSKYGFENMDVNIDGFAVVFNGPRLELSARGYPGITRTRVENVSSS